MGVEFLHELYRLGGFLACGWGFGYAIELCKGPGLIGELFAGILLGPHGLDFLPKFMVEPLTLIGQLGLLFLVFEGGLNMDVEVLRRVGIRAVVLALTGTALPVIFGWLILWALGFPHLEAVAGGTALSSTAIGFIIRLMNDAGILATDFGQLITAAAMIDDVFSLVVLAVLQSLQFEVNIWYIFRPIVASVVVWIAGIVYRMMLVKVMLAIALKDAAYDRVLFVMMAASVAGFTYAADYFFSTHLLGTFMAGTAFAPIRGSQDLWARQMPHLQEWLVRVFFSASMAFVIPVSALFEKKSIADGLILTLAAILGKFLSGAWAEPVSKPGYWKRFVQVGCAMVGRGELGFMLASQSVTTGLMTPGSFSATIWALVLATILGPFLFRASLRLRVCLLELFLLV